MRVDTKDARKGKRKPAQDKAAPISLERASSDLLNFLTGQDHLPDVPIQEDAIMQTLKCCIDDDLLTALKQTEETAVYGTNIGLHQDEANAMYPQRQLINMLEEYQKARLRDAIERCLLRPIRN